MLLPVKGAKRRNLLLFQKLLLAFENNQGCNFLSHTFSFVKTPVKCRF
jgi:hypothetical protein